MAETEMFGPYRLDGLIGRGGMGEVFRAFDTVKGREVAIKRLPARLTADPEFEARFRAESALAARLHEPHIIPIHDYGEVDGRLFIDMRLVEGRDLAAALEDGPLPAARAANIVAQVAAALDVAHAQDLVHRDIKPSNILVTPAVSGGADFVYVADFGIARVISSGSTSLTATGATVGSMEYMAPERFAGGHGDHRVDVYSLGCVLFEAMTGRKPFDVEGLPAIINAHLNTPPPRPSEFAEVPKGLNGVVARAMAKNPDNRYPSAGALAEAARAAADGAEPEAGAPVTMSATMPPPTVFATPGVNVGPGSPVSPTTHADPVTNPIQPPSPRRRKGLIMAAALAGLLVLVGGGLALGLAERADPSEIKTEPMLTAGDNPFMPSVGSDRPGVTPPSRSGGAFAGDTPGLYGGTRNESTCNRGQMIDFLRANPDKQDAWGRVQGIGGTQVPDYISRLTPVLLRSDTAVTNHGWKGGEANPLQSVLQGGTAVLVDEYGVPRARCSCGNPLTPPATVTSPRYTGQTWNDFSPAAITRVQAAPAAVDQFAIVDPASNETFYRGRGTAGEADRAASVEPPPAPPMPPVESTPIIPPVQPPPPPAPTTQEQPPPPPVTKRVEKVSVRGDQQWTDAGIAISEGDQIRITARGTINVYSGRSDFNKSPAGGPDCTSSNSQNSGQWTANGFPCWSLLGRVSGKPFYIGSGKSFEAQTSGTLRLGINDESSASFNDNSGSWQVTVEVESN